MKSKQVKITEKLKVISKNLTQIKKHQANGYRIKAHLDNIQAEIDELYTHAIQLAEGDAE